MLLRIIGLFKTSLAQIRRALVDFGGGQFGQAVLASDRVVVVILLVGGYDGVAGFVAHSSSSPSEKRFLNVPIFWWIFLTRFLPVVEYFSPLRPRTPRFSQAARMACFSALSRHFGLGFSALMVLEVPK